MSRTTRRSTFRSWYRKESKENRKELHRRQRGQEHVALVTEKFDDAPRPRGTQGWMTH